MHPTKLGSTQPSPISLGTLLVSGGFITTDTLNQALSTQRWNRRRLGEVLLQRHELFPLEKQAILALQKKLSAQALELKPDGSMPKALQLSLGQLLLDNGEITQSQLDTALAEHRSQHRRLGEVLIDQQALSPICLARWLKIQKKLISAAAVAAWMMASSCNVAADENKTSLWKKFIAGKLTIEKTQSSKHAWGQQGTEKPSSLTIKNRDLSELSRSSDGTLTLRFGHQGLNIVKRF
ncbi:hypothetical protein [Zhongshania sp.]|uniref:hypothetical protein n=1 Tax=Zhongshania sp. TaxID=1971902 RepID=UPI0035642E63